jgi:hypothetical protein
MATSRYPDMYMVIPAHIYYIYMYTRSIYVCICICTIMYIIYIPTESSTYFFLG